MKKITATAVLTTICSLSFATSIVAPAFAQSSGTTATPAGTTPTPAATPSTETTPAGSGNSNTPSIVEELKLSKDQQMKLAKLNQTVMQKKIGILTPNQKEQVKQAMQQGKTPTLTLTVAQQQQLKAIQASALKQQDEILTKEQREKLKAYNKQYNSQPQK